MRGHGPNGEPLAEHIASVAARLFYEHGIGAVGVDRIAAADVTKRTLYRHVRSKEALIAASLRRSPRVDFPGDGPPVDRILGAFRALEAFMVTSAYRGCPYIFYSAELTERTHSARRIIEAHLEKRRAWFRERAAEGGFPNPEDLASNATCSSTALSPRRRRGPRPTQGGLPAAAQCGAS